uniref:Uncharacterized protein n=1 Tax=Parascaris univalens TaxID=6257 RepID=A0A915B5C8_PARUN
MPTHVTEVSKLASRFANASPKFNVNQRTNRSDASTNYPYNQ